MKEFWNARYAEPGFAYGTEPNTFFKDALHVYRPKGSILLPADGEGRNAVYAAKQGLKASAFDISEAGRNKALLLAENENVEIDFRLGGFSEMRFAENSFDVMAIIFVHQPEAERKAYLANLLPSLKTGGLVILEEFSKTHVQYNSANPAVGGPKSLEMLNSIAEIKVDFAGFEQLFLEEAEVELNEGKYHIGTGHLVRFIGRKL